MMLAPIPTTLDARRIPLANGDAGLRQTISHMRGVVRVGRVDPLIRATAMNIAFMVPGKDELAEICALFEYVRDHIRYVRDVYQVETIASARKTLEMRAGDCDDQSTLLASLFETIGYPTRFVVTAYNAPGELEHVYVQVCANGEWIDCDPTENGPLGWAPPDPVTTLIERV